LCQDHSGRAGVPRRPPGAASHAPVQLSRFLHAFLPLLPAARLAARIALARERKANGHEVVFPEG